MMQLLLITMLLQGDVTVTLPMEAHVRGTEVELGEIAEISGTDASLVASLQALELGYAPAPGYSRLFAARKIKEILSRKAPRVTVRFAGQPACRVFPEVTEISGDEIARAAKLQLQRTLGLREATLELVGSLAAVEVPAGAIQHRIEARLGTRPTTSKTISVPVDIHVDGVRYRTVWTSWDVKIWETRPVLARGVLAGQELRPQMFERRRVLLQSTGGVKPLDQGSLFGAVALRDMKSGELVTGLDVNRPTVVALGESVFLRVKNGSIEARVSAVALQSGAIGDRIRLQTANGAQELIARIISRDVCLLDLGQ